MIRFAVLTILMTFPTFASAQSRFVLKGEITDGSSLFPPGESAASRRWQNYGDPPEGYPIDYTARLNVVANDDWTFNFTAMSMDSALTHHVAPPDGPTLERGEESLSIDQVVGSPIAEFFTLHLNLQSGDGDWNWHQDCFVCDLAYPLPSAVATVTSIDVLPIPDGDFNDDGLWDRSDIDFLMSGIAASRSNNSLDLDGDGAVDDRDRDAWLADAGPRNGFATAFLLGDANLDGTVNSADLGTVGLNWRTDESIWSAGNFTGAGVNAADLNALAVNWQNSVPMAGPVPEPLGGMFLWVLLVLGRIRPT